MGDFGPEFHCAGRCSMYLLWLESRIKDFLCIRDAEKRNDGSILREYNEMRRTGKPSRTYEKEVFKWARKNLGPVIEEFLNEWPVYKSHSRVSRAFKIAEIHRNAFAHAYMGSGDRLVFVPNEENEGAHQGHRAAHRRLGRPRFLPAASVPVRTVCREFL